MQARNLNRWSLAMGQNRKPIKKKLHFDDTEVKHVIFLKPMTEPLLPLSVPVLTGQGHPHGQGWPP